MGEKAQSSGLKTMQLNDQKAGMVGLDKELINKIIYEASKGTPYFAFQEKRQKSIDSKVAELHTEMQKITEAARKASLKKVNELCENLEKERDLSHSIVHIDMDAFYAAVEMLDNPALKDKPIAVGSSSMLSTSNYHARKYGVRAAMPGFIAKKLCPELIIVPCNFDKYRAVSQKFRKVVAEYDPHYSAASLDEIYFDLTPYIQSKRRKHRHQEICLKNDTCDSFSDEDKLDSDSNDDFMNCIGCADPVTDEDRDKMAYDIVEEIRKKICEATQLTASAGIAPNTMLAKVCSDQNKPNGQFQIPSSVEAVKSFIATLPVKKVSGIGPVQGQILNSIGINTCSDMWEKRDLVGLLFTLNSVEFYMAVALGIGSTTVRSEYIRKSIGNERTFRDTSKPEDLYKICGGLCDDLIDDLKSHKMLGKVLVLKIKTAGFVTHTRNCTLAFYTSDLEIINNAAKKLLDAEISASAPLPLKLRLMGIRMCNLVPEDSVSSSEKQQITLKSFLQRAAQQTKNLSRNKESFTCPICLEEYEISLSAFNDHVNNCENHRDFQESDEADLRLASSMQISSANDNKEFFSENEVCTKSDKQSIIYFCPVCGSNPAVKNLTELNTHIDSCLNKVTVNNCANHQDFQESDKTDLGQKKISSENKDTSDTETAIYICPVCGSNPVVKNLTELNTHIDSCLNKVAIKEILAGESQISSKRKLVNNHKESYKKIKRPTKDKRIDEYFPLA